MARNLLLLLIFLMSGSIAYAQTSLAGKVTEEDSGEPVIFGNVALIKNGNVITGTDTDIDGNYNISNIDPGTYNVQVSYIGFQTTEIADVVVFAGKTNKLDVKLGAGGGIDLDEIVVVDYKVPLIEQDNTTQGGSLTSDQIKNLPTRDINALAANVAGIASTDEGDDVSIRGSRANATNYYVDGIRVQGNLIPESEIDQLQVITGGIQAQYGDVTGGIISITTKGPSSKFSGGVEAETSEYLDAYGQSLVGFNMSGPILKKKDSGESILGFRIGGRYTHRNDDDPNAVDVFQITDEALAELEANPIREVNGLPFVSADYMQADDVKALDAQPNEEFTRYDLTAKLDARLSDAIDISFTGAGVYSDDFFTPSEDSRTLANWRLLNSHNNPLETEQTYRGNFRFRHRLGGASATDANGDAAKASVIQNASYTLQFGYENNLLNHGDSRHGENYFNYGYVGSFEQEWIPTFNLDFQTGNFIHTDYLRVLRGYTPGTINPVLANYNNPLEVNSNEGLNSQIGDFALFIGGQAQNQPSISRDIFYAPNGRISTLFNDSWGFHTNVGTVYNRVRKEDDDIYTFNANSSFDLLPGGSESGRHSIQFGIVYEQRTTRRYDVMPRNLWDVARQQANNHIAGIPENPDSIGVQVIPGFGEAAIYDLVINEDADARFYKEVRNLTGQGLKEYVNTDGLDPNQLSLDLFSARELNDEAILNYWGYDYLGNEFEGTFDDFFTARDENGVRTFPVAANRPIYASAYIQDKFQFKDIIFRVGLRIDRYDANTKVLKDNYSLYEIQGASDYHAANPDIARPGNIGDDFAVYLNDSGSGVQGYRDGDQFYFGNGTPANNPALVFDGGLVNPAYVDDRVNQIPNFIKSPDFDPNVSFEDYKPQINWMPRLAFSFPISTEANFFAHYDILVQRPASNTIATAMDYFYFTEDRFLTGIRNNPNLVPEKTIDYEVGFQQKLSNTSALKIAAYYKEMRDMIQRRTFFPVPIVTSYTTYDNIDFGTVKGFSFGYDMRRTGNITFNANYTLQFADGTGSDADSQRGLTSRGNIRTLFPLNFDERHRLVTTIDYRYAGGKKYTGPVWFGKQVFENAGINLQAIGVSGRPYTAKQTPEVLGGSGTEGSINGSRLPWNFTINMRIDKDFQLGNNLNVNAYVRVSNVLDRRNTIRVYEASGSAETDGFLASTRGADTRASIEGSLREYEAYVNSYQWRVLNPNFYSLPRRIFVGASVNF